MRPWSRRSGCSPSPTAWRARRPRTFGPIRLAGATRKAARIALFPTWDQTVDGQRRDDVALIEFDRPVRTAKSVPVATSVPTRGTVLGRGLTEAPRGGSEGAASNPLHRAMLRTVGDEACATTWSTSHGNDWETFLADRMLCAIDVDGKAPLSFACVGDSGGPFFTGSPTAAARRTTARRARPT